jgi:hypothetical protein
MSEYKQLRLRDFGIVTTIQGVGRGYIVWEILAPDNRTLLHSGHAKSRGQAGKDARKWRRENLDTLIKRWKNHQK